MVMITLPPELEQTITERAHQQGTTPELLVLDELRLRFAPPTPDPPVVEGETMYDYLKEFIGCLDSGEIVPGGARMSENIGQKFAEGMEEKRRQGRI